MAKNKNTNSGSNRSKKKNQARQKSSANEHAANSLAINKNDETNNTMHDGDEEEEVVQVQFNKRASNSKDTSIK